MNQEKQLAVSQKNYEELRKNPIVNGKLTQADKLMLIKIIQQEYNSHNSMLQTEINIKREEVIKKWKIKHNVRKLEKNLSDLHKKIEEIEKKKRSLGFGLYNINTENKELNQLLLNIEEKTKKGHCTKSKLITRVLLSNDKNEALNVMRVILGNDII